LKRERSFTSVNNSLLVEISNSTADGPDQMGGIVLIVVALATDPVKEFATLGQLRDQVHYKRPKEQL
jgi:hypothetical protein